MDPVGDVQLLSQPALRPAWLPATHGPAEPWLLGMDFSGWFSFSLRGMLVLHPDMPLTGISSVTLLWGNLFRTAPCGCLWAKSLLLLNAVNVPEMSCTVHDHQHLLKEWDVLGPKQADFCMMQSFPTPARQSFLQTAQRESRGQIAFLRYSLKLTLWSPTLCTLGISFRAISMPHFYLFILDS